MQNTSTTKNIESGLKLHYHHVIVISRTRPEENSLCLQVKGPKRIIIYYFLDLQNCAKNTKNNLSIQQ